MKKNKALASIFKNLPIELWKEVAKFKTKGKREYSVSIHGREPLPGKKYGWGGSLKLDDCQSVDVYVRPTDESYFTVLRHENKELSLYNVDLLKENQELSLYNVDLLKENQELQELRELLKLLDRRQGGERRSRKAY